MVFATIFLSARIDFDWINFIDPLSSVLKKKTTYHAGARSWFFIYRALTQMNLRRIRQDYLAVIQRKLRFENQKAAKPKKQALRFSLLFDLFVTSTGLPGGDPLSSQ